MNLCDNKSVGVSLRSHFLPFFPPSRRLVVGLLLLAAGTHGAVQRQAKGDAAGFRNLHALSIRPPRCNSGALPQLNSPDGHGATSVVAHICQQCRTKLSWKMQGVTVILAQAPGKPDKTRSIAGKTSYICRVQKQKTKPQPWQRRRGCGGSIPPLGSSICRFRPHEGGGDTRGNDETTDQIPSCGGGIQ